MTHTQSITRPKKKNVGTSLARWHCVRSGSTIDQHSYRYPSFRLSVSFAKLLMNLLRRTTIRAQAQLVCVGRAQQSLRYRRLQRPTWYIYSKMRTCVPFMQSASPSCNATFSWLDAYAVYGAVSGKWYKSLWRWTLLRKQAWLLTLHPTFK